MTSPTQASHDEIVQAFSLLFCMESKVAIQLIAGREKAWNQGYNIIIVQTAVRMGCCAKSVNIDNIACIALDTSNIFLKCMNC